MLWKFIQIQVESSVLIRMNIVYTQRNVSVVQVEPGSWYYSST
jgi:hypothetical protein